MSPLPAFTFPERGGFQRSTGTEWKERDTNGAIPGGKVADGAEGKPQKGRTWDLQGEGGQEREGTLRAGGDIMKTKHKEARQVNIH